MSKLDINTYEKIIGSQVVITGKIVEYLKLGKQEWFTIQLSNNQKITLNVKDCKIS